MKSARVRGCACTRWRERFAVRIRRRRSKIERALVVWGWISSGMGRMGLAWRRGEGARGEGARMTCDVGGAAGGISTGGGPLIDENA